MSISPTHHPSLVASITASTPAQQPAHQQPAVQNAYGPVLNRKQRRKLEKRMRSAGFRRRVRHVVANRARESESVRTEALNHARSELGAHGQLDIDLSEGEKKQLEADAVIASGALDV